MLVCTYYIDEKGLRMILGEIEQKMTEIIHAMNAKGHNGKHDIAQSGHLGSLNLVSDPSPLGFMEQPYHYTSVRPPTLTLTEMHRKDTAEEEYPLTYDELKAKVWRRDSNPPDQK